VVVDYNKIMSDGDRVWMMRALALAETGRGYVEPNPLVGAVVVQGGNLVGEGAHRRFGEAHAEVVALTAAGDPARGATLYVTLEPCCHHGKTPPCTEAILRAGLQRVVIAMLDPFPEVAGQGAAQLREAGIAVEVGLYEAEARRLNTPYLTLLKRGRPYIHAKWAMTLDGKICTRTGDSKWIGNEAARRRVHELRGRMDAVIVGIGTALVDNPLLTVRPPGCRVPTRIVLDSQGRLPPDSQLVRTAQEWPMLLVTAVEIPPSDALRAAGCEVLTLEGERGRPSLSQLLENLGKRRMTNVLVEGGAEVLGSFMDAGVVDEVWAFVAPLIVGGLGKTPVGGVGVAKMAESLSLRERRIEVLDEDVLVHGLCRE
jgi:diaminohydroxyphosphoribosylaminopyrimidine deaminase/5-amino-6-(5-phosphoribosylamino)uracil reductase